MWQERWFEAVWADRETRVYPELFGPCLPGIRTLTEEHFRRLGVRSTDPRWSTHGVLESPPNDRRDSTLYVTSGLSNPWGVQPDDPALAATDRASGLGFELVLETKTPGSWASELLLWLMAIQILVASGMMEGELLEPFDRIPLGNGIDGHAEGRVRNLIVAEPRGYPSTFRLASGRVALLLVVGTTDEEHRVGTESGGEALMGQLQRHAIFPLTDPARTTSLP